MWFISVLLWFLFSGLSEITANINRGRGYKQGLWSLQGVDFSMNQFINGGARSCVGAGDLFIHEAVFTAFIFPLGAGFLKRNRARRDNDTTWRMGGLSCQGCQWTQVSLLSSELFNPPHQSNCSVRATLWCVPCQGWRESFSSRGSRTQTHLWTELQKLCPKNKRIILLKTWINTCTCSSLMVQLCNMNNSC